MIPWWQYSLLSLGLAGLIAFPARADEKEGMPDLAQIEQTCLPTSTANLIIWFGKHGYPKLLLSGATSDDRDLHVVHGIMMDTNARFDLGTRPDTIATGIEKYIREAGYDCDVEYRGLGGKKPFTQDWLKENDDPNKGFILLLAYMHVEYNPGGVIFSPALNMGHAVTLVNAEPDMILIHDPAHENDETGRKIITPEPIPEGTLQEVGASEPVAGLLLLKGSLLGAPPDSEVMLTGAVCVTMHQAGQPKDSSPDSSAPSNATIAAAGTNTPVTSPSTPIAPNSANTTWVAWLFELIFGK